MWTFSGGGFLWLRAAVLYLPIAEGGQGLIDISSRVVALRLQTVQRLLYRQHSLWAWTADVLLCGVEGLLYDKQLFLLNLINVDLSRTTVFYRSVLKAWRSVFRMERDKAYGGGAEEPLFYNPLVSSRLLDSGHVRQISVAAGLTKLAHLRTEKGWKSAAQLSQETGISSQRVLQNLLEEIKCGLPGFLREVLGRCQHRPLVDTPIFPSLAVQPATEQEERTGELLSFLTPVLPELNAVPKKALYVVAIKVLRKANLTGISESRWSSVLAPGSSPRESWRSLYQPRIEKR